MDASKRHAQGSRAAQQVWLPPGSAWSYARPWYYPGHWVEMTGAQFDELTDRGKELLASARITAGGAG